jgi:hypothetical protein
MAEIPYGLDEEDFERMAAAVRKVEGLPPRREGQAGGGRAPEGAPHNWVKVTSATPATITLQGGGTATGFAAVWSYFDSAGAGWTDTANVVWFVGANGETPTAGTRYECRCLGADQSGVTIWGDQISSGGADEDVLVRVTSSTFTTVNLAGGGTVNAYAATAVHFVAGLLTNIGSAWLAPDPPLGTGAPTVNKIYLSKTEHITDTSGVPVYYYSHPQVNTATVLGVVDPGSSCSAIRFNVVNVAYAANVSGGVGLGIVLTSGGAGPALQAHNSVLSSDTILTVDPTGDRVVLSGGPAVKYSIYPGGFSAPQDGINTVLTALNGDQIAVLGGIAVSDTPGTAPTIDGGVWT